MAGNSKVLSAEKHQEIVQHLINPDETVAAKFKWWVKAKNFQVIDLPGLGLKNQLVVPSKEKEGSIQYLRVVSCDNMYDILHQVHAIELQHSGYKKVLDYVQSRYYGLTRSYIQKFCASCATCQLSHPQITHPPLKPIMEEGFLDRIQIDLIDMRHSPDGDYHYIGHVIDHFSKYHVLFPLVQKTAAEVAKMFEERFLCYFGAPRKFHSDNGREFVNNLIRELLERWSGDVTFVNGRPRHAQSQGCVERSNRTVEKKICAMKEDGGYNDPSCSHYPWASWLPQIMYSMNVERHETIKETPYRVVFGQKHPSPLFPGATQHLVNEEDLEDEYTCLQSDNSSTYNESNNNNSEDAHESAETMSNDQPAPHISSAVDSHEAIRNKVRDETYKAAAKMASCYAKRKRLKVKEFKDGASVSVAIPKLDRTSTDSYRMPGIITGVHGEKVKSYTVATEFGILKDRYRAGDLQDYTEIPKCDLTKIISLREAATKKNSANKFISNKCLCTKGCKHKKCSCRKNGLTCSSTCHPGKTCTNKEYATQKDDSQQKDECMETEDGYQKQEVYGDEPIVQVEMKSEQKNHESEVYNKATMQNSAGIKTGGKNFLKYLDSEIEKNLHQVSLIAQQQNLPVVKNMPSCVLHQFNPAFTLCFEVDRLTDAEAQEAGQRISMLKKLKPVPADSKMDDPSLLQLVSAIYAGAYYTGCDVLDFCETLNATPGHLLKAPSMKSILNKQSAIKHQKMCIGDSTFSAEDLKTLQDNNWLNDRAVHAYLALLEERFNQLQSSKCLVLPCHLYNKWIRGEYNVWLYPKKKFNDFNTIFVPINVNNNHWGLLVSDPKEGTVGFYNSLRNKLVEQTVIQHWRIYLEQRDEIVCADDIKQYHNFGQHDNTSCGVFILMAAETILAGKNSAIMRQCHVPMFRQYSTKLLLQHCTESGGKP